MTDASPPPSTGLDAYAPAEIAVRVEAAAMAKARLTVLQTLALGMLAGAFIAVRRDGLHARRHRFDARLRAFSGF